MNSSATTWTPERKILLACAAAGNDESARAELCMLVARSPDWNGILTNAESHGVIPLLRARLDELCPADAVPAAVRRHLQRACLSSATQNLRMTGELLNILQALEEAGIEAVPFKGPALASQLFGNVAQRQFRDLDILVRPGQISAAIEVMLSRGYLKEFELTAVREAEYLRSEHALQFHSPSGEFIVEIHWNFGSRYQAFPLTAAAVWERLRVVSLQGRSIRALSNEDLCIYLCLHGAKHGWDRLEWICSLAQLMRTQPLDWLLLFRQAVESGSLRALRLGLLLAKQICAVSFPATVASQLSADPIAASLASQVKERLLSSAESQQVPEIRRQAFYIRTRERLTDRARILLLYWFRIPHPHSRDWELFRLPDSLSFLYYLLRPLRLLGNHGLRLLQRQDSI